MNITAVRHGLTTGRTRLFTARRSLLLHEHHHHHHHHHRRRRRPLSLLTLAIETSCDDTCVAVLEKSGPAARLLFNKKLTSDNTAYGGVHPTIAIVSHTAHTANLIQEALFELPLIDTDDTTHLCLHINGVRRRRPDFVSVTRGPGMTSNLAVGLNTAKGLAVAWQVPLLAVNHMQAHALTPRLVTALAERWPSSSSPTPASPSPRFPFLTLLVSGGHTQLVLSRSLTNHTILAASPNIAIGDMLDKCARAILPASLTSAAGNVMYGAQLEQFAFPSAAEEPYNYNYNYTPPPKRADEILPFDSGLGWTLTPPLHESRAMAYNFTGLGSQVQRVVSNHDDVPLPLSELRMLAFGAMKLAFEHLASRVIFALTDLNKEQQHTNMIRTLVVSGGVASNRFLMTVLRGVLDVRGFKDVEIVAPPPALCTDNAAMIAWTGMEMWEAGWRSEMDVLPLRKWSVDSESEDKGILGVGGWRRVPSDEGDGNGEV